MLYHIYTSSFPYEPASAIDTCIFRLYLKNEIDKKGQETIDEQTQVLPEDPKILHQYFFLMSELFICIYLFWPVMQHETEMHYWYLQARANVEEFTFVVEYLYNHSKFVKDI